MLAMANEAVGRPKWTPPTLPVRTTSFAEDDEKQQADAALFRKFLVEHGSAEEIIKVLVSHYEGASGSPTLLPAELTAALGTQVAPSGKFPMALPELVKGRAAAATASSLHAENSELKSKVAQLSDTLVPKLDAAHESGLCEHLTVTLTEIHVANVPDMDPGASKSDPFLRVSVAGPQPQLEWMAQTGPSANAERVVRWEGEELSLTVPVPAWSPANCIDKVLTGAPSTLALRVTLWDDDLTNPDDYMGTLNVDLPATVGLKGADGEVSEASMEHGTKRVLAAPAPAGADEAGELGTYDEAPPPLPCVVSFKYRVEQAGFGTPAEPTQRADIYH